jgi:hypothetical protein
MHLRLISLAGPAVSSVVRDVSGSDPGLDREGVHWKPGDAEFGSETPGSRRRIPMSPPISVDLGQSAAGRGRPWPQTQQRG